MRSTRRRTSSTRRMRAIRSPAAPPAVSDGAGAVTGSPAPFRPALEDVAREEDRAADQEPAELGVHVPLAEPVHEERDAEREHPGDLEALAEKEGHRAVTIASRPAGGNASGPAGFSRARLFR